MAGQPGDTEFERRFIEWYVWASQHVSFDPRRCRAAAWAAVTATGTQEELAAIAQHAAFGPELDELESKPSVELSVRADEAAKAARPKNRSWVRTCGIIAGIIGVLLLVAGGVCFAIISMSTSSYPSPTPLP